MFKDLFRLVATFAVACLLPFAAGCESDDHGHEAEDPETEACEHLAEGPAEAVQASLETDAAKLADVGKEHTRFDVELVDDGTGQKGGYVKFAPGKAGDYLLVLDKAVGYQLVDAAGATVAPEASKDGSSKCTTVVKQATYELAVGTYRVKLGPTGEAKVGLLFEAMAHAD